MGEPLLGPQLVQVLLTSRCRAATRASHVGQLGSWGVTTRPVDQPFALTSRCITPQVRRLCPAFKGEGQGRGRPPTFRSSGGRGCAGQQLGRTPHAASRATAIERSWTWAHRFRVPATDRSARPMTASVDHVARVPRIRDRGRPAGSVPPPTTSQRSSRPCRQADTRVAGCASSAGAPTSTRVPAGATGSARRPAWTCASRCVPLVGLKHVRHRRIDQLLAVVAPDDAGC